MREMLRWFCLALSIFAPGSVSALAHESRCTGSFTWEPGDSLPSAACNIPNTGNVPVTAFAAVDADAARWLTVTPASTVIPAGQSQTFQIALSPKSLLAGTHSGSYRLTSVSGTSRSESVYDVALTVKGTAVPRAAESTVTLACTSSFRAEFGSTTTLPGTCTLSPRDSAYTFTLTASQPWLRFKAPGGSVMPNEPGRAEFAVDPAGLAPGTYVVFINARSSLAPDPPSAVVVLNISPAPPKSALTVSQSELAFRNSVGSPWPAPQEISVSGTQEPLPLAVSVKTSRGGEWLFAALSANVTPARLAIAVSGDRLAPGRYDGTVTISRPGSTAMPVDVRVSLVVDATISLTYHLQAPPPEPKCFAVFADGESLPIAVSVSVSQGEWLVVEPANAASPNFLCVSARTGGMSAGEYLGRFVLSPGGLNVDVKLTLTPPPRLVAVPGTLSFLVEPGKTPAPQTAKIIQENNATEIPVTASVNAEAQGWLRVTPGTGETPMEVRLSIETAKLTPGKYGGVVRIASTREGGPVVDLPVNVDVPAVMISVATPVITLNYAVGTNGTAPQSVIVLAMDSTGRSFNVAYRITTTDAAGTRKGPDWLVVSAAAATTPAPFLVSLQTDQLVRGTYSANIVVEAPGTTNGKVTVPVNLTVVNALLIAEPANLTLEVPYGTRLVEKRQITVRSSDAKTPMSFSADARVESGRNWLSLLLPVSPSTPANLTVGIDSSDLPSGAYRGTIVLTSTDSSNRTVPIPITLVVRRLTAIQIVPSSVEFSYQIGYSLPQPKVVRIAGETTAFRTSIPGGASWMGTSESGGTTPSVITVSVNPAGLAPGTYSAGLRVEPMSSEIETRIIRVSLTITAAPRPIVSPSSFEYEAPQGSMAPIHGNIEVRTNGNLLSITASGLSQSGNWLSSSGVYVMGSLDLVHGTILESPVNIPFRINPGGLAAGSYKGAIELAPEGQDERILVPVSLLIRPVNLTLPIVSDGGGTKMAITLLSLDQSEATYTIRLYQQDGQPMVVPLANGGRVQEITGRIPAGGVHTIETTGTDPATIQGWAEIVSLQRVGGYASIVSQPTEGASSPTAIPLHLPQGKGALAPFDNTLGGTTAVTVVNPASSQTTVGIIVRAEDGVELGTLAITLEARSATSVSIGAADGSRGTVEFSSSAGDIAVYAARKWNDRSTALPSQRYPRVDSTEARSRLIPHFVDGAGQRSAIVLMNSGRAAASFSLAFRDNYGSTVAFPIADAGQTREYSDMLAPGAVRFLETAGAGARLQEGTVELTSPNSVTGTVVYLSAGGSRGSGAADVDAPTGRGLLLPFDATQGGDTYLAIANPGVARAGNTFLRAHGEDGQSLGTADLPLAVFNRKYVRATTLFPAANGRRGVIEVVGPEVALIGIQTAANGTTTFVAPVR
ncbi:MAG: hypothetical protein HYX27_09860 [Acidobacteria bacterium]|nr:hypothetical protein [Acidobacteriota bacterium]